MVVGGCTAGGAFSGTSLSQGLRLHVMMRAMMIQTKLQRACIVCGAGLMRGLHLWLPATLLLLLLVGLTAAGFAGEVLIDCESHSKSQRFYITNCASLQLYFNLLCISMVENTIAFMWTRQPTSPGIIVVVNAACTGTFVFANPPLVCVCLCRNVVFSLLPARAPTSASSVHMVRW